MTDANSNKRCPIRHVAAARVLDIGASSTDRLERLPDCSAPSSVSRRCEVSGPVGVADPGDLTDLAERRPFVLAEAGPRARAPALGRVTAPHGPPRPPGPAAP